jgi:hypothetical protein
MRGTKTHKSPDFPEESSQTSPISRVRDSASEGKKVSRHFVYHACRARDVPLKRDEKRHVIFFTNPEAATIRLVRKLKLDTCRRNDEWTNQTRTVASSPSSFGHLSIRHSFVIRH